MVRWDGSNTVICAPASGSYMFIGRVLEDGTYTIEDINGNILEHCKMLNKKYLGIRVEDFAPIARSFKEEMCKAERDRVAKEQAVSAKTSTPKSEVSHPIDDVVNVDTNNVKLGVSIIDSKIYMKADDADKIKYTLDGKDITNFAKVYKDPIDYEEGMIIKAKAYKDGEEIACYGC